MPNAKVVGSAALTFQGNKFSFDPRSGFSTGFPWRGPFSQAQQMVAQLVTDRVAFDFEQDGPFATITLKGNTSVDQTGNGGAEVPVDRWDLRGNEVQPDIRRHPKSLAIEAAQAGALATIQAYADWVRQNYGGASGLTAYQATLTATGALAFFNTVMGLANAQGLFALLAAGQDAFERISPVLRHTYTISDNYAGSAFNFDNAETIYTTAQLLAECAAFPYPLPVPYIKAINSIPAPAGVAGYTVGWKKTPPDGNTAARYKNEIVTEYKFDQWSTGFVYGVKG